MNPKRTIHVVEQHDQVLEIWRSKSDFPGRVLHLDFHCDLRGLLIDRKRQRAFQIWDRFPRLDEGNFLTHAVLEGLVTKIRWVHDDPGGRRYDLKTVKYESDLTALPHRAAIALKRRDGIAIDYGVLPASDWTGIERGEVLDVDWDYFACEEYPIDTIERRVAAFFSRDFSHFSEDMYVCYSPNYSHPSRDLFERFIADAAELFDADVMVAPPPEQPVHAKPARSATYRWVRRQYHRAGFALRKHGIY